MFDVKPGHGYDIILTYDGDADGEPIVEVSPVDSASVKAQMFDHVNHTFALAIDHNGTVVEGSTLTVRADGDFSSDPDGTPRVNHVIYTETFNFKALPGATTVSASVSAERPSESVALRARR